MMIIPRKQVPVNISLHTVVYTHISTVLIILIDQLIHLRNSAIETVHSFPPRNITGLFITSTVSYRLTAVYLFPVRI